MPELSIYSGVSLGPDRCTLIAGPKEADQDNPVCAVVHWSEVEGFDGFAMDQLLTRMESLGDGDGTVICTTAMGRVCVVRGTDFAEEQIGGVDGPSVHGYICSLRRVGANVFAAGMGRQVYQRTPGGIWTRCDEGVLHETDDILDARGFTSIDGNEDLLCAVGHKGEIWLRDAGAWHQTDSPTNLLLYGVRLARNREAWVCGQSGLLLHGAEDNWTIVDHEAGPSDIVSIECFGDWTFFINADGVFRMRSEGSAESVNSDQDSAFRFTTLHAGVGALWAFGPQAMARTADGETWTEQEFSLQP